MAIQKEILQLQELGCMPDELDESLTDKQIDSYTKLFHQVESPINFEEAEILVGLFPEHGLYGIEWTLLHLLETISISNAANIERYISIIDKCPSEEWRDRLTLRLKSWRESNLSPKE